jgi:hypothetical protein
MARNYIPLEQIVNDFIIGIDVDDNAGNVSDTTVRAYALRGIREMGFDMLKRIRSIKISVNQSNSTAELPDDYVDWSKVAVVGADGLLYVLGENKNINYSQVYSKDVFGNLIDSDNDGVYDREDSKSATNSGSPANDLIDNPLDSYLFTNYFSSGAPAALYGIGGGHTYGQFRVNLDQNRIELSGNSDIAEIVIEYVADEALSKNPSVHVYAEEALRAYIYYKMIERKSSVPANEKARARSEYYNEYRKANARMKAVTKSEILRTIRKNFKQSPKL